MVICILPLRSFLWRTLLNNIFEPSSGIFGRSGAISGVLKDRWTFSGKFRASPGFRLGETACPFRDSPSGMGVHPLLRNRVWFSGFFHTEWLFSVCHLVENEDRLNGLHHYVSKTGSFS